MIRMKKKQVHELAKLTFGVDPIVFNRETKKFEHNYWVVNPHDFVPVTKKYSTVREEGTGAIQSRVISSFTVDGNIELLPF